MSTTSKPIANSWISDNSGAYVRPESTARNFISRGSRRFPPARGRYHLFVSYACPWANRCIAMLAIKGLEDVIGVSVTHPVWKKTTTDPDDLHFGWTFIQKNEEQNFTNALGNGHYTVANHFPNTVNKATTIRQLYELSNLPAQKYSVPLLWDKKENVIVNNESAEIVRMLNSEFNEFAKFPHRDMYPQYLTKQINDINAITYPGINNGVYRCGFAKSQQAYESAMDILYDALDYVEDILSKTRFLCGSELTGADLRLFMTLIRFDEVYAVHFKTNRKLIREYHNIFNYTKDVYQMYGIGDTVFMDHIKLHYYGSHPELNPLGIIPIGSNIDYNSAHDRERQ